MKSKGDVAGSGSERALFFRRGRKRMTCPSELRGLVLSLQICFNVNSVAVWDAGRYLVVFVTVLCE